MLCHIKIGADVVQSYRIAVIPGDGIGQEVVPEGLRVLDRLAALSGAQLAFHLSLIHI